MDTPDGRMGFLYGALPRIVVLSRGRLEITAGEEKNVYYNEAGLLRVTADGIYIVTSDCAEEESKLGTFDKGFAGRDAHDDKVNRRAKARIVANIEKSRGKKFDRD